MNRPYRLPVLTAVLAAAVAGLAACGGSGSDPLAGGVSTAGKAGGTIVIGSANFSENVLLAQIYAQALEAKGIKVKTNLNIGSREVLYGAMKEGSLDVLPEYNGALLSYVDAKDTSATTATVDDALTAKLASNLTILTPSPAQDNNTVAVTKATAAKYNLKTIADLAPVSSKLNFGAAPEDKTRQQGLLGLQSVYGVKFKSFKSLDTAGPLTISALEKGNVDAAILYSTTPEISSKGFVALTDPKDVFGVQNVIPLVNRTTVPKAAQDVLNSISAALDTDSLTALNAKVQVDQEEPEAVAKTWLQSKSLG
jgi:osmoprotectant transport system substrate-binding protein